MSSQHVAGEKVDAFGGIVGVLTYVVEEIAEIGAEGIGNEEEGGSKEEEESVQDEMLMEMINNNYSYYTYESSPFLFKKYFIQPPHAIIKIRYAKLHKLVPKMPKIFPKKLLIIPQTGLKSVKKNT